MSTKNSKEVIEQLVETHFYMTEIVTDALLSKSGYRHLRYMREDLVAEGYMILYESARDFDETRGCAFASYASFRIHHALINYIRAAYKESSRRVDIDSIAFWLPDENSNPEDKLEEDPKINLIEFLEPETDLYKEVYYRCILNGDTASSVAKSRGVSDSTIKTVKLRLLKKFRKEIVKWQE